MKIYNCEMCHCVFNYERGKPRFCGSLKYKTGCSYQNDISRKSVYSKKYNPNYYISNIEKIKEVQKIFYYKNIENIKERHTNYKKINRDKIKVYLSEYYKKNKN